MADSFGYVFPKFPVDALLLFTEEQKLPKVRQRLLLQSLVLLQPLK
jgi:hypothetical protein